MLPNNLRELCLEIVLFNEKCCCTHCYWQALNLAIGDTIRSARVLPTVFDAARDICKLMELSPITNSKLDEIRRDAKKRYLKNCPCLVPHQMDCLRRSASILHQHCIFGFA